MDACATSKKQDQIHAKGIFERFPGQLGIISINDSVNHFQNHVKN